MRFCRGSFFRREHIRFSNVKLQKALKTLNIALCSFFAPPPKKNTPQKRNEGEKISPERNKINCLLIRRRKTTKKTTMTTTKGRRGRRRTTLAKKVARVGAAAVLVAGVVSRLEVAVAEYQCPSFGERIFFLYAKRLLLFLCSTRETLFRVLIDPRSFEKQIPRGWKNWPRSVWKTRTGCAATCA